MIFFLSLPTQYDPAEASLISLLICNSIPSWKPSTNSLLGPILLIMYLRAHSHIVFCLNILIPGLLYLWASRPHSATQRQLFLPASPPSLVTISSQGFLTPFSHFLWRGPPQYSWISVPTLGLSHWDLCNWTLNWWFLGCIRKGERGREEWMGEISFVFWLALKFLLCWSILFNLDGQLDGI